MLPTLVFSKSQGATCCNQRCSDHVWIVASWYFSWGCRGHLESNNLTFFSRKRFASEHEDFDGFDIPDLPSATSLAAELSGLGSQKWQQLLELRFLKRILQRFPKKLDLALAAECSRVLPWQICSYELIWSTFPSCRLQFAFLNAPWSNFPWSNFRKFQVPPQFPGSLLGLRQWQISWVFCRVGWLSWNIMFYIYIYTHVYVCVCM